jgi:hypothetical protein
MSKRPTSRIPLGIDLALKSRVADVADFIDALERIAKGASVVDPSLTRQLVHRAPA